jgi:hypothetical protein
VADTVDERVPNRPNIVKKLTIAAWDSAAHGTPEPWPLQLLARCRYFSALPHSGGMLDQDEYTITAMLQCDAAQRAASTELKQRTGQHFTIQRYVEVAKMLRDGTEPERFRKRLINSCGTAIFDEKGAIDKDIASGKGIGEFAGAIDRWLMSD